MGVKPLLKHHQHCPKKLDFPPLPPPERPLVLVLLLLLCSYVQHGLRGQLKHTIGLHEKTF